MKNVLFYTSYMKSVKTNINKSNSEQNVITILNILKPNSNTMLLGDKKLKTKQLINQRNALQSYAVDKLITLRLNKLNNKPTNYNKLLQFPNHVTLSPRQLNTLLSGIKKHNKSHIQMLKKHTKSVIKNGHL